MKLTFVNVCVLIMWRLVAVGINTNKDIVDFRREPDVVNK